MRSFFLIPAIAALTLALSGCEVQPVVSAPATPATPATGAPAEIVPIESAQDDASEPPASAPPTDVVPEIAAETPVPANSAGGDDATETADADTPGDTEADEAVETPSDAQPTETVTAAVDATEGEASPDPAPETESAAAPKVTELALAAPPPPPPAELTPSALVGSSLADLQSRLGPADFTRREGRMETWQYRLDICVVDYFLFPNNDGTRVVGWAWRAPVVGDPVDALACRRSLAGRDSAS